MKRSVLRSIQVAALAAGLLIATQGTAMAQCSQERVVLVESGESSWNWDDCCEERYSYSVYDIQVKKCCKWVHLRYETEYYCEECDFRSRLQGNRE